MVEDVSLWMQHHTRKIFFRTILNVLRVINTSPLAFVANFSDCTILFLLWPYDTHKTCQKSTRLGTMPPKPTVGQDTIGGLPRRDSQRSEHVLQPFDDAAICIIDSLLGIEIFMPKNHWRRLKHDDLLRADYPLSRMKEAQGMLQSIEQPSRAESIRITGGHLSGCQLFEGYDQVMLRQRTAAWEI